MTSGAATSDDAEQQGTWRRYVAGEYRAHLARGNMSQRALARALGVTAPWVNERLSGRQAMSTDDMERIAGVLGMTPMELLTGQTRPPSSPGPATVNGGQLRGGRERVNGGGVVLRALLGASPSTTGAPAGEPSEAPAAALIEVEDATPDGAVSTPSPSAPGRTFGPLSIAVPA